MHLLLFLLMVAAPPTSLPADVHANLDRVINSPMLQAGTPGAYVGAIGVREPQTPDDQLFRLTPYDNQARPELYTYNADAPLTPASNCKLFTVAAALDALGPDYTWTTAVKAARGPQAGLVDNLYLIGGGDPTLDYDRLRQLAEQVKAAGVSCVNGAVICDGSRYRDKISPGWDLDDVDYYFEPEIWGIALGRNQVDVTVRPGGVVGRRAQIAIDPGSGILGVRNEVVTASSGTSESIHWDRDLSTNELVIRGRVPNNTGANWTQGMAVPNVPRYVAVAFTKMLKNLGVEVHGAPRGEPAPQVAMPTIANLTSPPLREAMVRLMKKSDNLYAEMFNRELGLRNYGEGSAAAGVRGVMAYLAKVGVDGAKVSLTDGCGVSVDDRVTVRATAGVLLANAFAGTRDAWWHALPVAGVDGTLSRRMDDTAAENNVHAKTGYIRGATALSGYLVNRDNDLLIVSTIFNRYSGTADQSRAQHDKFFVALANWDR